ncbi:DUF1284 domain-containing protein [Romboutsia sp. 1001713B170207_170306_H8]|uniref:DUF1284 domain-containing protein n=1 Tax=Romboutsia sp. 1001713B170207_170306_H8 TaxID=2787112 RepID=UPI0008211EDC|nr:DUF1284 domain-containing protein [Romboutsia sp. 1001713B170207_170306_H8]SCH71928.1 Protein of uncharacterised function (DUF1284) [uncultured Clostridium sp.]
MLKIRPHHILCMRAYTGSGYSKEFSIKIESIIRNLKVYNEFLKSYNLENEVNKVEIVYSTDSICESCPNKLDDNICNSQEKVNLIDCKMIKYFNIKEGVYNYKYIENLVYNNINEVIFDDICRSCEWYHVTNCKKYIL